MRIRIPNADLRRQASPCAPVNRRSLQKMGLKNGDLLRRVEAALHRPFVLEKECIDIARDFFSMDVPALGAVRGNDGGAIAPMHLVLFEPKLSIDIEVTAGLPPRSFQP